MNSDATCFETDWKKCFVMSTMFFKFKFLIFYGLKYFEFFFFNKFRCVKLVSMSNHNS